MNPHRMRMAHANACGLTMRNPFWYSKVRGLSDIESCVETEVVTPRESYHCSWEREEEIRT